MEFITSILIFLYRNYNLDYLDDEPLQWKCKFKFNSFITIAGKPQAAQTRCMWSSFKNRKG